MRTRLLYRTFGKLPRGDFAALLAARVVQMANGFATSVVVVWIFGLSDAGTYAIGLIGLGVLSLVAALGLPSSLPHARATSSDAQVAAVGFIATGLAALPALLLSLLFGWSLGHSHDEALAIAIFSLSGLLFGQGTVLQTLLVMQQRARHSPLPHFVYSIGIAVAGVFSHDLVFFACVLFVFRLAGNLLGFSLLRMSRPGMDEVRRALSDARGFLSVDVLVQCGLQAPLLMVSYLLSRDEMGVFGICRQILYAALTPGWSLVQSKYPALVAEQLRGASELIKRNWRLSIVVSLVAMAGSIVLGFWIYGLPVVVAAMAILLLALPGGYASYLYDTFIRATGNLRACNELAALRAMVSIALFGFLAGVFEFWGAIAAAALSEIFAAAIYRRKFRTLWSRKNPRGRTRLLPQPISLPDANTELAKP